MRWLIVASLSALLAAGCGQQPAGPADPSPSPEAPVTSEYPEDVSASPSSRAPAAPIRVTGVVTPGVEANCLLLEGYLLIGGDPEVLRLGATVTVTGRVDRDVLTTCQQGTPLLVATAEPAG